MHSTIYLMVLIVGCIVILHVLETSAQNLPDSVRITSFGLPNQHSLNNIIFAIPSSFDTSSNQQLILTKFPSRASAIPSSSTASSSLLPPSVSPNAFTQALLASPTLRQYFNIQIPRFQAADLFFNIIYDKLKELGHPTPASVANVVTENMPGLEVFTLPPYFYIKGNFMEKLLISKRIKIVPSLVQGFANSVDNSVKSSTINSNETLIQAIQNGMINFMQSIGLNYIEDAYIAALIFNEETIAAVKKLQV